MSAMEWTAMELARITGGRIASGAPDTRIRGISHDTRTLKPDDLYIALRGERFDGHIFLADAAEKGAAAVLVDEMFTTGPGETASTGAGSADGDPAPVRIICPDTLRALGAIAADWRSRFSVRVAAVTGSNGKTTTRAMIGAVLSRRYAVLETEGNLNNEIGLPRTLLGLGDHHEWAAVELGMNHAGEIRRLTRICRPDIAVITNIGPAHIGGLGSLEAIAAAKAELLEETPSGGLAVLNRDDPYFGFLAGRAVKAGLRVVSVGFSPAADIHAVDPFPDAGGLAFRVRFDGREFPARIGFSAPFMIVNALAAVAAGREAGLYASIDSSGDSSGDASGMALGLAAAGPVGGRMCIRDTARGIRLVDDTYNANPASAAAALSSLGDMMAETGGGRIFAVLGEMLELGDHAPGLHRETGRKAAESGVYWLAALGPHAPDLLAGARGGGMPPDRLVPLTDHGEGVDRLKSELRAGDLLLVKGSRGWKMENILGPVVEWAEAFE
ncbi:MAG: hypothetical protein CR990_00290 [Desulfococcus sp.]|nr:MAG: hypothetical protein CR990_00290 [Desulfococcus sp.]